MLHHRVNEPNVISESIDGEVVIIALATGTYYSLRGTGARAWDGLAAGRTTAAIAADLATAFAPSAEPVDVAAELDAFVATLVAEGLIVPTDPPAQAPADPESPVGPAPAWEPLVLETFTDMQELILLDPVHEVAPGQGWPVAIEHPDR